MTPPSQKHRKIGFYLEGGEGGVLTWNFTIRPEELIREEPSRLTVQQTLGSAWVDAFDRGVSTITLKGHTGWRGGFSADGAAQFENLRSTVFTQWHARRKALAEKGQDPEAVGLYFADTLDRITARVAPKTFTLRRSKDAPLLMRYDVSLLVLNDNAEPTSAKDAITGALFNPLRWLTAKLGLENLVREIGEIIKQVGQAYSAVKEVVTQVCAFVQSCVRLVLDVIDEVRSGIGNLTAPIFSTVQMVAQAAGNGFGILATGESAGAVKGLLMRAASTMNDIACTIANGFETGRTFRSFDDLYGASNCSSTGGGRAWSTYAEAERSPLQEMFPPVASRVSVSTAGRNAIDTLLRDPLTIPSVAASQALAVLPSGVKLR
ncbi:hypothetical protein [Azospirillum sp. TSO22-1]|uniref:hypothetical protein n=1 Tax=Azospirillum sp. TSO22-1 TaxID=716789 RepID=UPI000D60D3E0|nr:hypothetical protein [Azospirillum sp. TSO22-1]PWC44271.1 hypothetical protein TSO221_18430 [Azospirillum sp. TSO22-1]